MELEFFVTPGTDEDWHRYWVEARIAWWEAQGVPRDRLELLVVEADELAHYSKATTDIMYRFPHGLEELEGGQPHGLRPRFPQQGPGGPRLSASVEPNTDSNTRLAIQNPDNKAWQVPYVIEPSAGVDRGVLAVLNEAYRVESLDNGSSARSWRCPGTSRPSRPRSFP